MLPDAPLSVSACAQNCEWYGVMLQKEDSIPSMAIMDGCFGQGAAQRGVIPCDKVPEMRKLSLGCILML